MVSKKNLFSGYNRSLKFLTLYFLLAFFCSNNIFSTPLPPFIEWQKCFGWTEYYGDEGIKIISTNDGNLVTIGKKTHVGVENIWFSKFNTKGALLWEVNVFDDNAYTGFRPTDIIQDTSGDFLIVARVANLDRLYFADYAGKSVVFTSNVHQNYDFLIMKISGNGQLIWQKTYGGDGEDIPLRILKQGNNFLVFCQTNSTDGDVFNSGKNINSWNKDIFLLKIDANGTILSKKCIGGDGDELLSDVRKTADNNFILIGNSRSNDAFISPNRGEKDVFVVKIDENFNILWKKTIGGTSNDEGNSVIQLQTGEFVLGISSSSLDFDFQHSPSTIFPNNYNENIWLFKLSNEGTILQNQILGGSGRDLVYDLQLSNDKKILLVGSSNSNNGNITDKNRIPANNNGTTDVLLMKTDAQFNVLWERTVGGSGDDEGLSLKEYGEGKLFVIGTTKSFDGDVSRNYTTTGDARDIWILNLVEPCEEVLNLNQQITNENTSRNANNTINTVDKVTQNSIVSYKAGKQINLGNGFKIEAGSTVNFNIVPCVDTSTVINQNPIQVKINNECREGGMKFVFRPFTPDTISANYKVSIENISPVIPISFTGNSLVEKNNSPYSGLPAFFVVRVSREGYQELTFQGYTGTCEHDGAPINCPENTNDLILNKQYYEIGDTVVATWDGVLLPNQTMQWFNENITFISQNNTTFTGIINNFPAKIQAQPAVNPPDRPCHGGVYALLRKKLN